MEFYLCKRTQIESPLRYFIQLAYNGTPFHGWQAQPNAATVQGFLVDGLSKLLGVSIDLVGAGRTDTGVHARMMMAHFDFDGAFPEDLVYRLNRFLPDEIAVERIWPVGHIRGKDGKGAHARFDATSRTYEYWITRKKDPFLLGNAWYWHGPLDVDKMNAGAQILMEYTDFECFSKLHTDVFTFDCRIDAAYFEQRDHLLVFTIKADRFLRNMVRAVVGTLMEVGQGKRTLNDLRKVILSKDRGRAGTSAPASGLYLIDVTYPSEYTSINE